MPCNAKGEEGRGEKSHPSTLFNLVDNQLRYFWPKGTADKIFGSSDRAVVRGSAGCALAPPIILEIGKILVFSTPNISKSKEGDKQKSH